jgi:hypothetical protein
VQANIRGSYGASTITIRTFSSAECCRRVARQMSRTAFSASSECRSTFDLISAPCAVKMSQNSSLPQSRHSVQLVLTGNSVPVGHHLSHYLNYPREENRRIRVDEQRPYPMGLQDFGEIRAPTSRDILAQLRLPSVPEDCRKKPITASSCSATKKCRPEAHARRYPSGVRPESQAASSSSR